MEEADSATVEGHSSALKKADPAKRNSSTPPLEDQPKATFEALEENSEEGTVYSGVPDLRIKGRGEGVIVQVSDDQGTWDEALRLLRSHLERAGGFFDGQEISLSLGRRRLQTDELSRLDQLLAGRNMSLLEIRSLNPHTRQSARDLELPLTVRETPSGGRDSADPDLVYDSARWEVRLGEEVPHPTDDGEEQAPGSNALSQPRILSGRKVIAKTRRAAQVEPEEEPLVLAPSYLYRGTLRSGQVLRHAGTVIVVGDVNPGGQVISGGDVYIWGKLRGVIHAGAMGDESAAVGALEFEPIQLRIAGHIAITPKSESNEPGRWFWKRSSSGKAEMARLINGQIVVDPWDLS